MNTRARRTTFRTLVTTFRRRRRDRWRRSLSARWSSADAAGSAMVTHAREYVGTSQGQCKVFVQKIYEEVYPNNLGTGYYQAYSTPATTA